MSVLCKLQYIFYKNTFVFTKIHLFLQKYNFFLLKKFEMFQHNLFGVFVPSLRKVQYEEGPFLILLHCGAHSEKRVKQIMLFVGGK